MKYWWRLLNWVAKHSPAYESQADSLGYYISEDLRLRQVNGGLRSANTKLRRRDANLTRVANELTEALNAFHLKERELADLRVEHNNLLYAHKLLQEDFAEAKKPKNPHNSRRAFGLQ